MKCNGTDGTELEQVVHTSSSILPKQLAERVVTQIVLVLSPVLASLSSATIRTTSKCGTASIWQVTLYFRNRWGGTLLPYSPYKRKSRWNHRSYVLTEALSGVCFYAGRRKKYLVKCEHMKVERSLQLNIELFD